jgi:protein-L-isoaspartate(D-aspartate) O-methyltransferase
MKGYWLFQGVRYAQRKNNQKAERYFPPYAGKKRTHCRETFRRKEEEKAMIKQRAARPLFFAALFSAVVILWGISGIVRAQDDIFAVKRQQMVEWQIRNRGITDKKVLEAMTKVERHLFVPKGLRKAAYEDTPLPIGNGQTISQPYIVAYMTEAARLGPDDRVLEIGTGSGYQAAILAEIVKEVYTIEILKPLADSARARLKGLGYRNVDVRWANGYKGWPEHAPFDAIIVTAAPPKIPEDLVSQLKVGGRMVVPVGEFFQELYLVERTDTGFKKSSLLPVRFVPMVKGAGEKI